MDRRSKPTYSPETGSGGGDAAARARAEPVELAAYDPAAPVRFAEEATRLRDLCPDLLGRIEHIGSTAVPGLIGKPIVDLMVEVADWDVVRRQIAPALRRAGYDYFWRPTSPGDPDIAYAWFVRRDDTGRRTHHVHVAPPGSPYWDRVTFRDYLRGHPDAAEAYAIVKRTALAKSGGERRAYARAKSAFIERCLKAGRKDPGR